LETCQVLSLHLWWGDNLANFCNLYIIFFEDMVIDGILSLFAQAFHSLWSLVQIQSSLLTTASLHCKSSTSVELFAYILSVQEQ